MSYTHFTSTERGPIQALRGEGKSMTYIADRLGRDKSSVSREVRRNASADGYDAQRALKQYRKRRHVCRPARKLDYPPLWHYLIEKLTAGWTPEEVAGRLPMDCPDDPRMRISHETIYQAIYRDKRLHFLVKYLPQARPKRRRRGQGNKLPRAFPSARRPHCGGTKQPTAKNIVEELNNRPRKILGYRTPNEVFQKQREDYRVALGD